MSDYKQGCVSAGISMGRLRIHHQLNPTTRLHIACDRALLKPPVHQLHHILHSRTPAQYADPICWFPAHSY